MPSIEERLEAVLAAPIGDIVSREHQALPPAAAIREWDVPPADRQALSRWGLPVDLLMTPDFQTVSEPVLTPNVAGDIEGRLITADQRLYRLGRWGSHELTPIMGAVAGTGRVLGLRKAPLTTEDLHPDLRDHYAGYYGPSVIFINSTVSCLVELAWRWRAAVRLLRELDEQEPVDARSLEEYEAHFDRIQRCERAVIRAAAIIDPAIDPDDPGNTWVELITDL
ncbi:SUKH-4 family immunity protein [Actinomadura sp. 21ATH]|uniref:SUKH-4 family immunity protein n=1 Tax=Actinomadura sp. 21ATH TaxID=1735444 RepID=UPI0035C21B86